MRIYDDIGCAVGQVWLPREGVDPTRWAVVACDQFTSEPEYWAEVERFVGDAPSTLRLVYPEVYLSEPEERKAARIASIREHMARYLEDGVLEPREGMVYLERDTSQGTRRGLVLALDLERYDYHKGSGSLVRATEGTIESRLPPRIRIRDGAPLELPHIMVLVDDPRGTVFGPLREARDRFEPLYDFELMMDSGHLSGWLLDERAEAGVVEALRGLAEPGAFAERYGLEPGAHPVLLYAMGDGNHSLATAKAIWERTKERAGGLDAVAQSPLRYALVELVDLYDESLVFEPIHRVLFELREPVEEALRAAFGRRLKSRAMPDLASLDAAVREPSQGQRWGLVTPGGYVLHELAEPESNLAVGSLQAVLDGFLARGGAREIDYVHGAEVVDRLGRQPGNAGFLLPAMPKEELFRSVILDGALPRKTFSMGEARDKRFYFEARRLDRWS